MLTSVNPLYKGFGDLYGEIYELHILLSVLTPGVLESSMNKMC